MFGVCICNTNIKKTYKGKQQFPLFSLKSW